VVSLGNQANIEEIAHLASEVKSAPGTEGTSVARISCLIRAADYLVPAGRYDLAQAILLEAAAGETLPPALAARIVGLKARLTSCSGDRGAALPLYEDARGRFESLGDTRSTTEMLANVGVMLGDLGLLEEAEKNLSAVLANARRMGLGGITTGAATNLAAVQLNRGHLEEAQRNATEGWNLASQQGDWRIAAYAKVLLTYIAIRSGAPDQAIDHAACALEASGRFPPLLPDSLAAVAQANLARGDGAKALGYAQQGSSLLEQLGQLEDGEAHVRLALIEALFATGDHPAAVDRLEAACTWLTGRAGAVHDQEWRSSFLTAIPQHARILDLANEHCPPRPPLA
jgi:eukaryotic-like serine/threonine-protein kinase